MMLKIVYVGFKRPPSFPKRSALCKTSKHRFDAINECINEYNVKPANFIFGQNTNGNEIQNGTQKQNVEKVVISASIYSIFGYQFMNMFMCFCECIFVCIRTSNRILNWNFECISEMVEDKTKHELFYFISEVSFSLRKAYNEESNRLAVTNDHICGTRIYRHWNGNEKKTEKSEICCTFIMINVCVLFVCYNHF